MKKIVLLMCACAVGVSAANGQGAKLDPAKGLHDRTAGEVKVGKRIGLRGTVLQVLKEGLLMKGGYLLTGHPEQKKIADGDTLNFYAVNTGKTFKYGDTIGSERTVRIYRWDGRRTGG